MNVMEMSVQNERDKIIKEFEVKKFSLSQKLKHYLEQVEARSAEFIL